MSQDNFIVKSQNYWWVTYTTQTGIDIKFPKRKKEEDIVFISFSPHKQKNGNKHNADFFSLMEAQKHIESTLKSLGIERKDFIFWDISTIEIGVNYLSAIPPKILLECFLFYRTAKFHQHHIYKHYYYYSAGKDDVKGKKSGNIDRILDEERANKNCKIKHYWKAHQRDNDENLMFYQLGFCDENLMRFEVKGENKPKVRESGFTTLESLYDNEALERCIIYLNKHLLEIFVFNPKDIVDDTKLTKPQRKHYYQAIGRNFWDIQKDRNLTTSKSKWIKLPRKSDTKEIVIAEILKAAQDQNSAPKEVKSMSYFHTEEIESESEETPLYRGLNLFKNKRLLIDIGNTTRFCVVTGEDISMQRNGEPYLKREGLRFLKNDNPFRYNKIKDKFLSPKLLKSTEEKQIENIEKNIKNRIYNEEHNNISFQRRNYHPNQAQFQFK